jgi:type I restriction enzyme S subunit
MRLSDLLTEVRDTCAPGSDERYVGLEQIPPGALRIEGSLTADGVASTTKRFRCGDILFGTLRPYFRKVARARFDGVCSTDITVLRARSPRDAWFAFYVLADPKFIAHASATSNGTRMPRAKWSVLQDYSLPDFPMDRREHLGQVLSAYDELIAINVERIKVLEEVVRLTYRELIERRVRHFTDTGESPSRTRRDQASSPGWTDGTLGDHVSEVRDVVHPADIPGDTPYFGLEHLPRRSITLSAWGSAEEVQSTKLRVRRGDVLFGKIRPYFHKVGLSPVDAVCSTDAIVVRPLRAELGPLVLGCMSSDAFVAQAVAGSQGTKMPRANWDLLRRYPLAVPPQTALAKFNEVAGRAIQLASNLGLQNRTAAATRDLLLPRLLSGELAP